MQLWRTSRRRFITLLVAGAGISACSKAIDPIKVVNAEFDFRSMQKTYINQTEFSFDTNFKETGHEGTPTVSVLVFDSQNCSGTSTKQDQTSFDTMHVTGLQDGHTYSFKVNLAYDDIS